MPDRVAERLVSLPALDKPSLARLWKELYDSDPPAKLRRELMVRILGYRLQEQAFGGLSGRSLGRLRELAKWFEARGDSAARFPPTIKPGTRLVRQWQSETHVVHVEPQGYEYKGSRYESLSEIARLITGTRRSGPLFFGLKSKQLGSVKGAS